MPCGPHITLLHTLEYGHLDRTSDHPTQGVRAPSTPRPVALRSNRSDLRVLAHQQKSDLLRPISFKVGSYDTRSPLQKIPARGRIIFLKSGALENEAN